MDMTTAIGTGAAMLTTLSYIPQLRKCWRTRSAGDLSLKTFSAMAMGVALWSLYGILRDDYVIVVSNIVSLLFLSGILYFKLRDTITAHPA